MFHYIIRKTCYFDFHFSVFHITPCFIGLLFHMQNHIVCSLLCLTYFITICFLDLPMLHGSVVYVFLLLSSILQVIVNNASINKCLVYICFHFMEYLGKLLSSMVSMFTFIRNCPTFPKWLCCLTFLPAVNESFSCSTCLPGLFLCLYLYMQ